MKTQEQILKDYQNKLQQVKIWLPKEESCGVDYLDLIRQRAANLGYISNHGKYKGKGNINAYIISLLEKDLGIEIKSIREMNKD